MVLAIRFSRVPASSTAGCTHPITHPDPPAGGTVEGGFTCRTGFAYPQRRTGESSLRAAGRRRHDVRQPARHRSIVPADLLRHAFDREQRRLTGVPVEPTETPSEFPSLSRRSVLKAAGFGAIAACLPLSACSSGDSGTTTLRFYQSKPEVVGYFDNLVNDFNKSQSKTDVVHDSTRQPDRDVRPPGPHDLVLNNYDLWTPAPSSPATCCRTSASAPEITDDRPERAGPRRPVRHRPSSPTHVIPYSIAAAGVIYNKQLFDKQGRGRPHHLDRAASQRARPSSRRASRRSTAPTRTLDDPAGAVRLRHRAA